MKKRLLLFSVLFLSVFAAVAQNPCTSITQISCGVNTTFATTAGNGDINYPINVGGCNASSAQGGKEQIYEFTPTESGTFEFEVTSVSGGIVQYLWKQASLGCDSTGWNCINRTNAVESIGAVNFVAGTTYYILLNAEPTTALSHTFRVKCARVACSSIPELSCGVATTFGPVVGYGDPDYKLNVGGCNGSSAQGGKEQIYRFTASQTGTYEFAVTSSSGGTAQYMWKEASLGCDNTGWNCINRTNTVESIGAVNFTQGTTYYILVNSEPTTSLTQSFIVKCAKIVCNDIIDLNCGTLTTFGPVIGYGDPNYQINVGGCNGSTAPGGKEQIYRFVAPQTGTYEFEVTSFSGGVAQYMWKQASLGCDNTGWNCINRSSAVESIGAVNFTGGQTYYILVNSEVLNSLTHTFRVKCAKVVCNDILPLNCGVTTAFGPVVGYGDPNYAVNVGGTNGCTGFTTQGGKEQIYRFTASQTGTYEFEIVSATGGFVQYLWKPANLGCDNTGWNCINRSNVAESIGAVNFQAGTEYFILVNSETVASLTHNFRIKCVRNVCDDSLIISCGTPITLGPIVGYGDPDYSLNAGGGNGCTGFTTQGGKEQIYILPASDIPYTINVSAASGGYMQYLWKPVNLGCGPTGWTCLGRKNNPGNLTTTIPASTTSYIYLMVNSETTTSNTQVFSVICNTLATHQMDESEAVLIFPNPTESHLNIQLADNQLLERVVVKDLSGKMILNETPKNSYINVEDLSSGLYLIEILSGNKTYQKKFIKQ